jgi:hypothetical protein
MTVHPDSWLMTTSPCEMMVMEKSDFEEFLQLEGSSDDVTALVNIQTHPLLNNMSLASLHMLYFEGIKF